VAKIWNDFVKVSFTHCRNGDLHDIVYDHMHARDLLVCPLCGGERASERIVLKRQKLKASLINLVDYGYDNY
jgi:hypothetical protein